MEVLAPAGSIDSLKAAVLGGADGVYLGGRDFGARRMAPNLTDAEIRGAVRFCHDRGVKIYATVNTLIKERELTNALSFVEFLDSEGIDAVILQDRGLLELVTERLSIPVHASTQMGIHSPEGAAWARSMGVRRIILARELGLDEIASIRKEVDIELEVFIHGALCYSVSGQCLFSSLVGGRSGNRGFCAQPCRMRYSLGSEEGYLLSTADLMGVDAIPRLLELEIEGIKIEGRMRSPIYTYVATLVYKGAVSRAMRGEQELATSRESEMLEVAFNREFTGGYLQGEGVMRRDFPDSRGRPIGDAWVRCGMLSLSFHGLEAGDGITLYSGRVKRGGMELREFERVGDRLETRVPFPLQDDTYQAFKTKDREFDAIRELINTVRLEEIPGERELVNIQMEGSERSSRDPEISCYITSPRAMESVLPYADRVYFELGPRWEEVRDACHAQGIEAVLLLPRVSPLIPEVDEERLMVCTLGQMWRYRDSILYGHYSLNMYNSLVQPVIYQQTLSVELSSGDMREVLSHHAGKLEAMGFGRLELMVTADQGLAEGTLIDGSGRRFNVYRDRWGFAHLLNCADLMLLDFMDEMAEMGLDSIGLDLRRRSPDICRIVAKAFKERDTGMKRKIARRSGRITAGHFLRGVQ